MNSVPFNNDLERAVIVSTLVDPKILLKISETLSARDFYKNIHQEIFSVIESLGPDNLDSLAVEDKLVSEESKEYFKTLIADSEYIVPSLTNALFYAETIKDKAKLRAGINLGQEITALCFSPNADANETLANLEQLFAKFLQERVVQDRTKTTVEEFEDFLQSLGQKREEVGIASGFMDIDLMLHRLEGLIILAARPSVGKTSFAVNIARNVSDTNPVLFFSIEQSKNQIFERMLSCESEVALEDIRTQAFLNDRTDSILVSDAQARLKDVFKNLYIDDTPNVTASYITSVARQKKYELGGLGLILIDYLNIMKVGDKSLVQALGDACKELRGLSKELDTPVILLSQLRRPLHDKDDKEKKRRPDLTDLRDSGEIEQSADIVMFLYRDSYFNEAGITPDNDQIEIIIKKNRNGRTGIVPLKWLPKLTKFKDA